MINTFYIIEERVGGGNYITWDGIFSTKEAAEQRIKTHAANTKDCRVSQFKYTENCRVVEYQRGTNKGPVRVEAQ